MANIFYSLVMIFCVLGIVLLVSWVFWPEYFKNVKLERFGKALSPNDSIRAKSLTGALATVLILFFLYGFFISFLRMFWKVK